MRWNHIVLFLCTVRAAVLHRPNRSILQLATPGNRVTSSVPTASTSPSIVGRATWTVGDTTATITSTPVLNSESGSEEGSDRQLSSSSCTPKTICMDKMTCGIRYGGCYDKHHCDGNTSPYPIPTCKTAVRER
ncbi:unnamed protein product [Zymoseptoria tritici ST99CH_3D7]|uniref:Uncharacterized protein n=1 Tax=Zymoseptoria tritici (strain ST99CH_3D7) TaxID=1276538 RepID=A0A1X7RU18_ZYMT9|nr:unnamed protein product [Zymoseptoria tritici ST99CH_3D7]